MFTNSPRSDGFGAQYQHIIATIIYAEVYSSEYIYSKPDFKTVYQDDEKHIENIMNLNTENSFRNILSLTQEEINNTKFPHQNPIDVFQPNIDLLLKSNSMKKIKHLYSIQNKNNYSDSFTNVAIHIRRPSLHPNIDIPSHLDGHDVKHMNIYQLPNVSERFTSYDYFIEIIKEIKSNHSLTSYSAGKPLKFHIFSEGNSNDFDIFKDDSVELRLNENIKDTFTNLVYADILVTSASSFSYTAALLSDGIIYAKHFWHTNPSHWIGR